MLQLPTLVKNKTGKIIGLLCSGTDITNTKRAENKLKIVLKHSQEVYYIHDTHNEISYISPHSKEVLGYTPKEMVHKWTDLASDNPLNKKAIQCTKKTERRKRYQNPEISVREMLEQRS